MYSTLCAHSQPPSTPSQLAASVCGVRAQFRAMLNHYVFHTDPKKASQLDPSKPFVIPAGGDSLESIGAPPGASRAQMDTSNIGSRVKLWQRAVDSFFPPKPDEGTASIRLAACL